MPFSTTVNQGRRRAETAGERQNGVLAAVDGVIPNFELRISVLDVHPPAHVVATKTQREQSSLFRGGT
jgi:hypothetical protein